MIFSVRPIGLFLTAALAALGLSAVGCGGGDSSSRGNTPLSISLGSSTVIVAQDGTPGTESVNVSAGGGSVQVAVSGLPGGVAQNFTATNPGPSGKLLFTGSASSVAGTYSPTVTVSSGSQTASANFTLVVAVVAKVGNATDTTLGVKGALKQFMATSFQVDGSAGNFFGMGTAATLRESMLNSLGARHIRVQAASGSIPMTANTGAGSDWDFVALDQTVQPVLASADQSPMLQIAVVPSWMCGSNGFLDVANHLNDFAVYAANLVRYYNKGGFNWGGSHFQSTSPTPIAWWSILNEPAANGLTPTQYVAVYNTVVPEMLAVDPAIQFAALELSAADLGSGKPDDPELYLPTFVAAANGGGVRAPVNALAAHFYGGCGQAESDTTLFNAVPQFVTAVEYFQKELQMRPDLASVPVWTTENNVDSDSASANNLSTCQPTQPFVVDPRGTSTFFAGWRPYVFSQLGKAGNEALYHRDYSDDQQFGEVDASGNPYLSYWVDRTMATLYSSSAATEPNILQLAATDITSVETLATGNSNGTVVLMIVDRAVHAASDDNGSGDPRTVVVDLSGLNSFSAASLITIDATTSTVNGPSGVGVAPASRMTVTLPGYGVAFLSLTP